MEEAELVRAGKLGRGEGEDFHKTEFFAVSRAKMRIAHTHTPPQTNKQSPNTH